MSPKPTRPFVSYEPVTLRVNRYTHILHSTLLGLEKVCVVCKESWPLDGDFFHIKRDNLDGFSNRCKDCATTIRAVYRKNDKERLAAGGSFAAPGA